MPVHPTEPFGDPATSWVVGRVPVGWRVTRTVVLEDPHTDVRIEIRRGSAGAVLPGLVFAQDELDALLSAEPAPVLLAGLSALDLPGIEGGGYVALLDDPGTPDVHLRAWASRDRERLTVSATVPRGQWQERSREIMDVLESLQIPR